VEIFPEIDANWLLTGAGNMFIDEKEQAPELFGNNLSNQGNKAPDNLNLNPDSPLDPSLINEGYKSKQDKSSGEIESIIIFYKEGHFKRYIQD
jgi:hypothetical protein